MNKTEKKHTPLAEITPLTIRKIDEDNGIVTFGKIDLTHVLPMVHCEAYVRAVNAHDDLLDACKLMMIEHERMSDHLLGKTGNVHETPGMKLGRAAIRKAEAL